jgi:hypothetical protein
MPKPSDVTALQTAIRKHWSGTPSAKASRYVGQFFNTVRVGTKIAGKVEGNHGTYTVSIQVQEQGLSSACSCYIGRGGYCHHCEALAATFLKDENIFREVQPKQRESVQSLEEVREYLQGVTLEALLKELGEHGITQKALAESIGMNPRHLSVIKSSELRNHYFNELGATKLACLWVLAHQERSRSSERK